MEVPLDIEWESALAELLTELTEVQDAMLEVLTEKSRAMSRGDSFQSNDQLDAQDCGQIRVFSWRTRGRNLSIAARPSPVRAHDGS